MTEDELWIIGEIGSMSERIRRNERFIIKIKLSGDNFTNRLHIKHLEKEIEAMKQLRRKPHKNRHCPGLAEKKCFDCEDCAFVTEESKNYFRNLLKKVDKVKTINYADTIKEVLNPKEKNNKNRCEQ